MCDFFLDCNHSDILRCCFSDLRTSGSSPSNLSVFLFHSLTLSPSQSLSLMSLSLLFSLFSISSPMCLSLFLSLLSSDYFFCLSCCDVNIWPLWTWPHYLSEAFSFSTYAFSMIIYLFLPYMSSFLPSLFCILCILNLFFLLVSRPLLPSVK